MISDGNTAEITDSLENTETAGLNLYFKTDA